MSPKIRYHRLRPSQQLEEAVRKRRWASRITVTFGAKRNRHRPSGRLLFANVDLGPGRQVEAHARDERELVEAFERACKLAQARVHEPRRRNHVDDIRNATRAPQR